LYIITIIENNNCYLLWSLFLFIYLLVNLRTIKLVCIAALLGMHY